MTWVWIEGDPAQILAALVGLGIAQRPAPSEEPAFAHHLRRRPPVPRVGLPTIAQVQTVVAETWGVSVLELESQLRTARLTQPRHVAMYLARDLCRCRLTDIGAAFGRRDHTTVIHGINKVARELRSDAQLRGLVREAREAVWELVPPVGGAPPTDSAKTSTPVEKQPVETVLEPLEG